MTSKHLISSGIVINADKNKILLIRRKDKMLGSAWSIPASHIEKGETPLAALKRELREELKLEIIDFILLNIEEFSANEKTYVSFNFAVITGENFQCNDSIEKARWFAYYELEHIDHKVPVAGVEHFKHAYYK